METPVIAAFVAGSFALVAPLVTFVLTKAYERRFLEPIAPDRRKVLIGRWQGTLTQTNFTALVVMDLNVTRKAITGTVELRFKFEGQDQLITLSLTGGFLHDRFLKLDYKNTNPGTIQFGSCTLELAANPQTLQGYYVGYGSFTQTIVSANITLNKIAS